MTGEEFDALTFAKQVVYAGKLTDEALHMLELRVIALEEITAARWPRRILVRARLGKELRRSVAPYAGPDFTSRRLESVTVEWLAR